MNALSRRVLITASAFWRLLPQGMRRRWWLFRLFDGLARRWPVFRGRRGVLVIRMDGIGDMILFRNSLDHYANAFGVQADQITVLGCDSWSSIASEVFDANPGSYYAVNRSWLILYLHVGAHLCRVLR